MSTLQENVDIIKAQVARMKTALGVDPTTPLEEVTAAVEQGGGSSAKSNIYKVTTIEERDAITDMVEGDMCVVHNSIIENVKADSKFQTATFPDTVVLDTAITEYINVRYRPVDNSKMFDCWGSLTSSNFDMDCFTEEGSIRITYTSSDGITYTRTDTTGNPVDFGTEIQYENADAWNDAIGKFMQIKGVSFDGLFEFKNELKTILKDRHNNEYYVTGIPFCNMNTSCLEIIYDYEFDRRLNRISKFKSLMLMGGSYLSNVNDYVYVENNNLYGHSNLDNNANDTYRYDFTSYSILDGDHRFFTGGAIEDKTLLVENIDIDKLMIIIPKSYVTTEQCIYSDVNKTSKIISASATPSTTNNPSWNYSDINIPLLPSNLYKDNNAYTNYGVIEGTFGKEINNREDFYRGLRLAELSGNITDPEAFINDSYYGLYYNYGGNPMLHFNYIDTTKITNARYLFSGCTIDRIDLTNKKLGVIEGSAFGFMYKIDGLKEIILGEQDFSNVDSLQVAFAYNPDLERVDASKIDTSNSDSFVGTFGDNPKLKEIDISSWTFKSGIGGSVWGMFRNCPLLEKIDMRNLNWDILTYISNPERIFQGVPTDCLIIVKNNTIKNYFASKFSTMTNVKTVAEYEG